MKQKTSNILLSFNVDDSNFAHHECYGIQLDYVSGANLKTQAFVLVVLYARYSRKLF